MHRDEILTILRQHRAEIQGFGVKSLATFGSVARAATVPSQVTTTQAAEILNVSRPYLARLLDEGAIPYHRVGTHRRILLEDLLAYKSQRKQERKEGLQKLADLSQEYGLYDLSYSESEPEA
jgi:excisionase family DNA binding protein